ncbi:aryl-alcohol dehydrogenase [Cryptococcus wingfieldii CBS 7118]|uniref:Aryl-alcohol dehydrogenase n=1 Tax=Cryptococcus wingfieldii CBS 7118 TaxID=1295528 RepID=A0A1E3IVY6_9TREE|nr:aryl-alcohol dehydrogenase [Cryptococcus wingfieldii CBS 7118]ODN92759.1 aryl-alcohol dehydrogenase [Cryptococcus wingfieldii CBS 7118]
MPHTLLNSSTEYTPADDASKAMGEIFKLPAEPKTELGRYRILSPSAAIRVSPLCLGAMSLGNQWTGVMGAGPDFEESCKLLDTFYEAGGNFIDTANNYQDEQSEMIVGEWMEKRQIRDEIVLATKYSTYALDRKEGKFQGIAANYVGNHKKNLILTVDSSLKKLRTNYIDLLYVHWWDYSTSIPELMQSLNDVVKSGKVLYLGISDTPAWIVSQANEYARQHGLSQFVVYQGLWNVSVRDLERDVIPMCRANGMGLAPWGALGRGKFKSPEELQKQSTWRGGSPPSERDLKVSKTLQEVAEEVGGGVRAANVAMAWVRQALKIHLTQDQIDKLSKASEFDLGFPMNYFGTDAHYLPEGKPNTFVLNAAAHLKFTSFP